MQYFILFTYVVLFITAPLASLAYGAFQATCPGANVVLSEETTGYWKLVARCEAVNGTLIDSELNLDECVANVWGSLSCWENGGMSHSCRDCKIATGTPTAEDEPLNIQCACNDDKGSWIVGKLDLGQCVRNYDGHLGCV